MKISGKIQQNLEMKPKNIEGNMKKSREEDMDIFFLKKNMKSLFPI